MICTVIDNHIGKTSARYQNVFEEPEQQLQAASFFLKRKLARTALIEGRTAYQGYPILDASTPADVGGAGERIGIPDSTPNMPYTCVSSRHSQKCVTLLKLMMELIFFSKLLAHLFSDHFFSITLN